MATHSAYRPGTRGVCGHRHLTEDARDRCQADLLQRWRDRQARKAHPAGRGGKKRGVKGKKRQKRANR